MNIASSRRTENASVVEHEPLKAMVALYGGRAVAMRLPNKIQEGEIYSVL